MTAPVTNGADGVTDGGAPSRGKGFRFPLTLWLAYAVVLAIVAVVVASSFWLEASRNGEAVPVWPFAVDEATSVVVIFAVTPVLFAWAERLDPSRIGWPRTVSGHLAGMAAFVTVHIGGMTALRLLAYPLFGGVYGGQPLPASLIYEGRKDALTYVGLVVAAWLLATVLRRTTTEVVAVEPPATRRIEIRDGSKRIWLDPAEILWVEAAGNYVEVHLRGRSLLQRQTLSAMEDELAELDFVRIHRSRLVNRRHVRATETNTSGDFTVTLDDGRRIGGSRRWRGAFP